VDAAGRRGVDRSPLRDSIESQECRQVSQALGIHAAEALEEGLRAVPRSGGRWLNEDYPIIAARAKQEGAEIQWGDESGLRSDDVRGRGYTPKGQTPVLRVNVRREGLSVISTVTNKGQMRWKVFSGALNAKLLIAFCNG